MTTSPIAIVGIACRLPGADHYDELWANLAAGRSAVAEIPLERWDTRLFWSAIRDEPGKSVSKWCGLLRGVAEFDHRFFQISAREARAMDPQQRLLLQETWRCIEDAAIAPRRLKEACTGVYVGVMADDYQQHMLERRIVADGYAALGNYECVLANRISHAFGLRGASVTVNAACASSLVALHEAAQALRRGECEYALVGASNLNLHPWKYVSFSKAGMLSPDGLCKTFDIDANGYVPGDGVAVLLLQRLEDAVREGNRIHGVLRGSAVNHVGGGASITAPSVESQRDVVLAAARDGGVDLGTVTYVEAHGTGTSLGDPIEVEALDRAFRSFTARRRFCALGSVKSNLGHLEAAAGMAGVIKVLMMMRHGHVPRTLNVRRINPIIDLSDSCFEIAIEERAWERGERGAARRAGVSSFGVGGVNSHVVLEEYVVSKTIPRSSVAREPDATGGELAFLSAKSASSLDALIDSWRAWLDDGRSPSESFHDICATAAHRAGLFPYRFGAHVRDRGEFARELARAATPPREAVAAGPRWIVVVGRLDLAPGARLCGAPALVRDRVEALASSAGRDDLRADRFEGGATGPLQRYVLARAALEALSRLGVQPAAWCGHGEGIWPALVGAGIVSEEQVLGVLSGALPLASVAVARPSAPFFDVASGRLLMPFRFTTAYVDALREEGSPDGPLLARLIERATILWGRQFTLSKYMAEWDAALAPRGLSVESLLERARVDPAHLSGAERKLFALVIATSLRRLDRKWSLSRPEEVDDPWLREFCDLATDGALTTARVCELVLAERPDLAAIAGDLNVRQDQLDTVRPYRLARALGGGLEVGPVVTWLSALAGPSVGRLPEGLRPIAIGTGDPLASKNQAWPSLAAVNEKAWRQLLLTLWRDGADLDVAGLYPRGTFDIATLPPYPFDARTSWFDEGDHPERAPERRDPPVPSGGAIVYRVSEPMIRDHVLGGRVTVPGACMIADALARTEREIGGGPWACADVMLLRPVFWSDSKDQAPRTLETRVDATLTRFSLERGGEPVVTGRLETLPLPPATRDVEGAAPGIAAQSVYEDFARRGYAYGPALRLLQAPSRAVGCHAFPVAANAVGTSAVLHHAVCLEACFQALLTVGAPRDAADADAFHVPAAIEGIARWGDLARARWVLVDDATVEHSASAITGDATLCDALGKPLLAVRRVRLARVPRNFLDRWTRDAPRAENASASDASVRRLLYRPVWSLSANASAPATEAGVTLIVCGGDVAHRLAARLRGAVVLGLEALDSANAARDWFDSCEPKVRRIVFLLGLDAAPEDAPHPALLPLVRLCRALARSRDTSPIDLIVATRRVQVVTADEVPAYPVAAPLAGVVKAAQREITRLSATVVDLDDPTDDALLDLLVAEPGGAPLLEVAYRDGERFVCSLEPAPELWELAKQATPWRQRGVYVIVGGLGGIGRALSLSLARRYQSTIALVGRRAPDDTGRALLDEVRRAGGDALYVQADGTSRAELTAALVRVRREFGAIHGVVNSALVLADRSIRHMSDEDFVKAYEAKVTSSRLLAELTREDDLDFLVFFSSVLALQGNEGQTNYLAGCAFQDAYAPFLRAAEGRPAVTIDWGYWGETGAVADEHHAKRLAAQGIEALSTAEGLGAFHAIVGARAPRVVAARLSDERLRTMMVAPSPRSAPPSSEACEQGLVAIDGYARALLIRALRDADAVALGRDLTLASLCRSLAAIPKYERLLAAWLADLRDHELLRERAPGAFRGTDALAALRTDDRTLAALRGAVLEVSPDTQPHVALLDATLGHALAIVRGDVVATDVMFPGSSMDLVVGIYRDNAFASWHNRAVAAAVVRRIEQAGDRREPFVILELGAGTGGTSAVVLPALEPFADRVRYVYSDVSRAFTKHGKAAFGADHPFLEVAIVDVENIDDAVAQRFGGFDLVFGTNVLHATQNLARTLEGARRMLRPGGTLLLSELCRVELFWTSTFGFLDGWWIFDDPTSRLPHGPLASPSTWRALLGRAGFEDIAVQGVAPREPETFRQCVVIATWPLGKNEQTAEPLSMTTIAGKPPVDVVSERDARSALAWKLRALVATTLDVTVDEISDGESFVDLGVDSIVGTQLVQSISQAVGVTLRPTAIYDYPNIERLCEHLVACGATLRAASPEPAAPVAQVTPPVPAAEPLRRPVPPPARRPEPAAPRQAQSGTWGGVQDDAIAIVGVSGQFPGARDLDQYWENLAAGVDSVTTVPKDRWDAAAIQDSERRRPNTTNSSYGGFLDGIDRFDPLFFNVSPREAEHMDPQQRLFLQHAWKALENGGYTGARRTTLELGVFAGVRTSDYLLEMYRQGQAIDAPLFTGTDTSMLAGRLAYFLDARGPCLAIDTACSSSLVAIHLACQHLLRGDVDLAIAGGVFVMATPQFHIMAAQTGMLAPGGRCRTFDDGAEGFVPAEGVGVVVLRPLRAALVAGDVIHGVIRASACNQDGRTNGITAPSARAQARLIRKTYERVGVRAETISYVEAHGTGTKLGDPIEIEALTTAFRADTREVRFCAIGSVKTNIGHAITAAGVAAVLKVVAALRHKMLPPSLHFTTENRFLRLEETPFYVNTRLRPWTPRAGNPRRAAVSAFGFSGTNCHMVIEEAPSLPARATAPERHAYLFVVSAKTETALCDRLDDLAKLLARAPDSDEPPLHPGDVAYSLAMGRAHERLRRAFVATDLRSLQEQLKAAIRSKPVAPTSAGGAERSPLLERFVASLAGQLATATKERYVEDLSALADAYTRGFEPGWERIFPEGVYHIVSLPTYPFAEERYWGGQATVPAQALFPPGTAVSSHSGAGRVVACDQGEKTVLLAPTWRSVPPVNGAFGPRGTVVIMAREATLVLAREFATARSGDGDSLVVLPHGEQFASDATLDFEDHRAGEAVARELIARAGTIVGVVDLSDLGAGEPHASRGEPLGRVALLQALVEAGRQSALRILHVTSCLRPFQMSGTFRWDAAFIAAVVSKLGAEYARVKARTLDLDVDTSVALAGSGGSGLIDMLLAEWGDDDTPGEVLVRGGRRHVPSLEILPEPRSAPGLKVVPDGTYLVTGGVRGLGWEVAEHLVSLGARSLALVGLSPLPPMHAWERFCGDASTASDLRERLMPLVGMMKRGVRLRVHAGSLADERGLAGFLAGVRRELGPIKGCMHCAGATSSDRPAFVHKTEDDLSRVLAPKVAGLRALDRVLADDALDFFVLFSSVSALVPRLASSVLDYAAANDVMNRWAEAQAAEGGLPGVAIAWTNWTGAGMGDVAGPAYRDLGLLTHDVAAGLGLLDRAMATGRAVVLPTQVDDRCFSVQRLTGLDARAAGRGAVSPAVQAVSAASSALDDPGELLGVARAGVRAALGQALRVPEDRIGDDAAFDEFGVDSILVIQLIADLEHWLERKIPPGLPLEYPTVEALAAYLVSHYTSELAAVRARHPETAPNATPGPADAPARSTGKTPAPRQRASARPPARADAGSYAPVAIIGMACHFPEATDLDAYWKNLREGRDCVRTVPHSRWSIEKHYAPEPRTSKSTSRHGGFLDGIELFDPDYFEISYHDAPAVDPLIRQFLEVSTQCVRHAGYERHELSGRNIGVFVGSRVSNYGERVTRPTSHVFLGIGQNFIAAHVSQIFDLTGPSMVVDTACSSSLTSLHLAAKSLQSGECDMAIAGGVDILLDQEVYLRLSAAKVLSPDGRCFVFDERANGFVPGEGAGALLLKPLSRALADGDTIHAVVEASAVNNDGRTMGVTTPNPAAQKLVIEAALRAGAISPETIGYIEAHGTGTTIGDPIELKALTEVFRALGATSGGCGVGSVKANMGHLLSAAGVASIIKVALAISRRELPPTLHCERPNPRFEFESSPFFPTRTLQPWEPRGGFLRAGVSGFGFGGTNAHVILGRGPVGRSKRAPLSPIIFDRRRYWLDRADEEPRVTATERPLGSIKFNP